MELSRRTFSVSRYVIPQDVTKSCDRAARFGRFRAIGSACGRLNGGNLGCPINEISSRKMTNCTAGGEFVDRRVIKARHVPFIDERKKGNTIFTRGRAKKEPREAATAA